MKEGDRFSLVSYSSDATLDIPLTYMTKEKKEAAKAAVKALRAGGGTALCDGLVNGTCTLQCTTLTTYYQSLMQSHLYSMHVCALQHSYW